MIPRRRFLLGLAASSVATASCGGHARSRAESARVKGRRAIPGKRVAVVGAGVAGLAAATRLRESGAEVVVIESLERVGGRVFSVETPAWDAPQELGAQYINDHYDSLLTLFGSARGEGPSPAVARLNGLTATIVNGSPVTIDANHLTTYVSSGLVRSPDALAMAVSFSDVASGVRGLALDDFGAWAAQDGESAVSWLRRNYGDRATDYVGIPAIEGLFFGSASETSAATFKWMIANADRARDWYTSPTSNYAACTRVMNHLRSRGVGFVLGNPAVLVGDDGAGRVRVTMKNGDTTVADAAILTVAGASARALLPGATPAQARVLAADYAATVVVNVVVARPDPRLRSHGRVYGVSIPRLENPNGLIAAFSVEGGKTEASHGGRELYGFHLHDAAARTAMDRSDDEIIELVLREAERFVDGVRVDFVAAVVQRWPNAIPKMSVGHAARCHALWTEQESSKTRILVAGDRTTVATMDGAAWSGVRAAEILEAKLST